MYEVRSILSEHYLVLEALESQRIGEKRQRGSIRRVLNKCYQNALLGNVTVERLQLQYSQTRLGELITRLPAWAGRLGR